MGQLFNGHFKLIKKRFDYIVTAHFTLRSKKVALFFFKQL